LARDGILALASEGKQGICDDSEDHAPDPQDHGRDDHRVQVEDSVNDEDSRVQGRAEGGDQGPFGDEHQFTVWDIEDEHDEFVNTKH